MTAAVNVVILVGMLLVVPAGLRLVDGPGAETGRRLWLAGALPGAVSLWVSQGSVAAVDLSLPYAVVAAFLAAGAPVRLARNRSLAPAEVAVLTALVTPAVAAAALVAERGGYHLFGFSLTTLQLTVAHFHFAGFAAALVAGLVCRARAASRLAAAAALTVPAGIVVVFAGFFTSEWVQFAGAVVLTAGMWSAGWITWREIRPAAPDPLTRTLFGVSAVVLAVTMLLALDWALGNAAGLPHLTLDWMVATHGLANAFGFAVCGLAAWSRLRRTRPDPEEHEAPQPRGART